MQPEYLSSFRPSLALPNNNNKRRSVPRKGRRRAGNRLGSVTKSSSSRADKAEMGMSNSWVPALSRPKFKGRLRYGAAALELTAATSTVGNYVFTANGLFDPNITGGALQPAGFAQLITDYDHYTVMASEITVIFTNNTTTPTIVGIALEADLTTSTDINNMLELPYEQIVQLEGSGIYGSSKTLTLKANLNKFFGENVLKSTYVYRGDALSNPIEQAYFQCKAFGLKGGSADVFMTVKIEYTAMFTEPRELSPSLTKQIQLLVMGEAKEKKVGDAPVVVPTQTGKKGWLS